MSCNNYYIGSIQYSSMVKNTAPEIIPLLRWQGEELHGPTPQQNEQSSKELTK